MTNIKNHEHKSAFKKALSVMNQALETEYTLEGNTVKSVNFHDIMQKRANVIKMAEKGAGLWAPEGGNSATELAYTIVTADGFVYTSADSLTNANIDCSGEPTTTTMINEDKGGRETQVYTQHCASGVVDINGPKGPNKVSTGADRVNDQFYFKIFESKVLPGRYPDSVEPQIMYGKK